MRDNHRVTEEPCEEKFSRTVLESGGSREGVADFNFLDNDVLPVFGNKPKGWKSSGKRVKRGLFRTAAGYIINADGNGAANILRKVETQLGLNLVKVCRALLTAPSRLFIWNSKKMRRDATSVRPEVSF